MYRMNSVSWMLLLCMMFVFVVMVVLVRLV